MKAPPFTVENAAEMGRRSVAARLKRQEQAAIAAAQAAELHRLELENARLNAPATADEQRRRITLCQLDKLDALINTALDDDDADLFLRLTAAKERLWKLVSPTAGTLKPSRQTQRGQASNPLAIQPRQSPPAPPAQSETPPPIVVTPQIQGETPQN